MYFYSNLDPLNTSLLSLGGILVVIGSAMFVFAAFRAGLRWGCAVFFLAPVAIPMFMLIHWKTARKSLAIVILGYIFAYMALARAGQMPLGPPNINDFIEA